MIAKMKKVIFILRSSARVATLEALKEIGLVHLEPVTGSGETLEELLGERSLVERAFFAIPDVKDAKQKTGAGLEDVLVLAQKIIDLQERIRAKKEERERLAREAESLEPWGSFDPADLRLLAEKGVEIQLAPLTADQASGLEGYRVFPVRSEKSRVLAALVKDGDEPLPESVQVLPVPERGLDALYASIEEMEREERSLQAELDSYASFRDSLQHGQDVLDEKIEFETARSGMAEDAELAYFSGYCPASSLEPVKELAREEGFALIADDPDEEDPVPTKVENPAPIRIIQPVFDLMGVAPGYREKDTSLPFLLFFALFFAMIIGDAGYGALVLGFSLWGVLSAVFKRRRPSDIAILGTVMGVSTVVWGAITGTWFGAEEIAQVPFLKQFVIPGIYSFSESSEGNVKFLTFIIGAVQIAFAHMWSFITALKQRPRIRAFAQFGWFLAVLGLWNLVTMVVLGSIQYDMLYSLILIGTGLVLVIFFANQEGHFFKGIGSGFSIGNLIPTLLDSIGAFSDIISYIRLFAVGLATVEIAKSFNAMAAGMGDGIVGLLAGILILILGHTLNLAMGFLAVIVHGVRLNMLEFSGHLGMEWTGIPYSPFAKREQENNKNA